MKITLMWVNAWKLHLAITHSGYVHIPAVSGGYQ